MLIGSSLADNPDHPGSVTAFSGKDGGRLWRVTRPDLARAESAQQPYVRIDLN